MSLDAVTIVGLVLGILGLWGLPTLWKRVLYVSGKLNTSSQSSQIFSRPVKFHGNEPRSTHALRACWIAYTTGHRGTSEVLMGLRRKLGILRGSLHTVSSCLRWYGLRRYRECYTEMTFAYSALQWLMWIAWCFRADTYLSKLFALHEELSSLLERIRVSDGLSSASHSKACC